MLRRLLLAALLLAPALAHAQEKGQIDWTRRVIKARGQGAPDLNAPSISVARLGAERAAKADALRNLLETLKGATVENGANVGTLLQSDSAMNVKVQGALRGFRITPSAPGKKNPTYYNDGGVALEVELPIDSLPDELRLLLKEPAMAPPPQPMDSQAPVGGQPSMARQAPRAFIIDATGLGRPPLGATIHIAEEGAGPIPVSPTAVVPVMSEARSRSPKGTSILRAVGLDAANVVLTSDDAARIKQADGASIIVVIVQ